MDLLDEARAELTDARRLLTDHGGGHPNAYARAAQIAVVAQAEAAHRQADALERIADVLDPASPTVNDPADTLPVPWLSIFPVAADGTVLITNTVSGSKVLNLGDDYSATFPGWRMKITWEPTQ